MTLVKEFLRNYGLDLVRDAILALVTFIGAKLGVIYKRKCNTKRKREVVIDCVKAAEEVYKAFKGPEKLEMVKSNAIQILNSEGIDISELELDSIIHSTVAEFNKNWLKAGESDEPELMV